ncbi:MAG: MaoC family dehydratase [Bosea sp. (in: a-proteobacteria)]
MRCFEDFQTGQSETHGAIPVSEADIIAFASRYDAQDFHINPAAAKASFAGGLIASGWHSCGLLMRLLAEAFIRDSSGMGAPGVEEVKWLRPVYPGDVLGARWSVIETKDSRSRPEMGLVHFRFELLNQRGEPVIEQRNWIMFARRGTALATPKPNLPLVPPRFVPAPVVSQPKLPDQNATPGPWFDALAIGDRTELGSLTFSAEEIIAFAAPFDPQIFHLDAEAAKETSFGGLCASGWHTACVWMQLMVIERRRQAAVAGKERAAQLGTSPGFRNLRWIKPVFAGDTISYASTITDKRASASRPQWGLVFHHNTGVNQHGELVFSFDGCVFWERR